MLTSGNLKTVRLNTTPDHAALRALEIGTIAYLDGVVYTAREGVYKRAIEEGVALPPGLAELSAANFHCSPAAAVNAFEKDGK